MEEIEKEKIKKFMADRVMADAVKKVIVEAFLKKQKDRDVYTLAASRIAIDLLHEAFKDLSKISLEEIKVGSKLTTNQGL